MKINDLHKRLTTIAENMRLLRELSMLNKKLTIKLADTLLREALQRWDNCYCKRPTSQQDGAQPCPPPQDLEDEIAACRKRLREAIGQKPH